MIESYTTNISDGLRARNALNTAIKSLNNMITFHEFEKTHQNYVEITYSGPVKALKLEIKYPQIKSANIPIIGWLSGSIPVYLGTTDGKSVSVRTPSNLVFPNITNTTTKTLGELITYTYHNPQESIGSYMKSETPIKEELDNGIVIKGTEQIWLDYKHQKSTATSSGGTDIKYTNYFVKIQRTVKIVSYDYTNCEVQVLERF